MTVYAGAVRVVTDFDVSEVKKHTSFYTHVVFSLG